MDPFEQLVEALNRLADETEHVAMSITFSRSDTPIDWDFETSRWTVQRES